MLGWDAQYFRLRAGGLDVKKESAGPAEVILWLYEAGFASSAALQERYFASLKLDGGVFAAAMLCLHWVGTFSMRLMMVTNVKDSVEWWLGRPLTYTCLFSNEQAIECPRSCLYLGGVIRVLDVVQQPTGFRRACLQCKELGNKQLWHLM